MKLLALGVDHRSAPTSVREALAFNGPGLDAALDALRSAYPGVEFAILSTCNRVEIYAAGTDDGAPMPGVAELSEWLTTFHRTHADAASHLVAHHDEAAVGHIFRVASSLESLVLGEGQILGQVRDAYKTADARGAVGPILHEVFRQAIRVGKLVREQTGLDRGRLSVASVAVDLAREVFDTFGDKTVLVIGAGKMADLTLQHLGALRPGRLMVTNRNAERAEALAARWGGQPAPFDRLGLALIEADVVISTTAAAEPIVTYDQYVRVQRARRNRLALILDIAIPRDFDPRIGDLDQVHLYNVDELNVQVERNLAGRRKGIDPAQAIIERETASCLAALHHRRHAGALLRQLGDYADSVRRREVEKLFARCPDLTDAQRQAAEQMARSLQNQFLHHPRAALRGATKTSEPPAPNGGGASHAHSSLLEAVKQLFGLGPAEGPPRA